MKRNLLIVVLVCLMGYVVNAQENQQQKQLNAAQWSVNHYYKVYQVARNLEDLEAAKNALLDILVEVPKNDSILFELSGLYYQMQQYPSAAITAAEVLKAMPGNMAMLEVVAVSFENLGMKAEAVKYYEKIYLKTNDFGILYKVALFQYDLQRYGETVANMDILIGLPQATEQKLPALATGGVQKEFPLKVVLLNLKGMALNAQGKKEEAKAVFQQALELAPDFSSAKENLDNLEEN